MRRIRLPGTATETSWLGFGCASLGSRISARAGLAALSRAHEAGVTWFDLAPAYGAGQAEEIFAQFLTGRRDSVQVLTKVGLAPPPRARLMRAAMTVARPALGLLRGLRGKTNSVRALSNQRVPLTPDLIEASVANSLRRLGTSHVDVLALHDPNPADVAHEEVLRALERVLSRGQARFIGVAGSLEACRAGAAPDMPYTILQTAVRPGEDVFVPLRTAAPRQILTIGHSVFRGDADARLGRALKQNPDGITLLSMFSPAHLANNLAEAERAAATLERARQSTFESVA